KTNTYTMASEPNKIGAAHAVEAATARRLARLLADGRLCDAHAVVSSKHGVGPGCNPATGMSSERVPVVRALLAAVSPALEARINESDREILMPTTVSADGLRLTLAFACGCVPDAWSDRLRRYTQEEVRSLEKSLDASGLSAWWGSWCAQLDEVRSFEGPAPSFKMPSLTPTRRPPSGDMRGAASAGAWVLAAASVLAWQPAAFFNLEQGGFFMDDAMIKKNANVYEDLDWPRLLRTDYWGLEMFEEGAWTHKSWRPMTVITFHWNHALHGFDSSGFHVVNLILHALCGVLLGVLGSVGFGLPRAWSLLLVALFLAHPVHTENVLYIVGRADLLCFLLLLLASLVYVPCVAGRSRSFMSASGRLLVASALTVAAGLCKETGFCFFGLLAGWEILRGLMLSGSCHADWRRWVRLTVLLLLGTGSCFWRVWYTGGTGIERMDPHSNPIAVQEDPWVRVLSYALVHGLYAKLLVWPTFLCYDYSFDAVPIVTSVKDVRLLASVTAYLGFAQLLCCSLRVLLSQRKWQMRSREGPIVGVAIILLSFLPMSNIFFPVGTVIGERLLYIPSAGLLLTLVSLASHAPTGRKNLLFGLLLAAGLACAYLCALRVPEWRTAETITVADGWKQTRSSRVQFNLACVLLKDKRYEEALATYNLAIAIDPADHDSLPLYHAGQILFYQGKHEEAEALLTRAVSGYFSPLTIKEEEIWHDYGLVLWFRDKAEAAVENLQKALLINPTFTKALNNLACASGYG
ncbi:unnamed protein product, partial [Polarella glacialis]